MATLTSARTAAVTPSVMRPAVSTTKIAESDWPRTALAIFTAAVAVATTGAVVMMITALPAEELDVISRLMGMID